MKAFIALDGAKIALPSLDMVGEIELAQYRNNDRIAITISGARLTVNLPGYHLGDGEFFVKTWSENELIIDDIRKSGLFENTGRRVKTGFVEAEVWRVADG